MDKTTLFSYQPDYYKNSKVMDNINKTNVNELNLINDKLNDIKNQMFIDTVTTALDRWEYEFGLPVVNNYNLDYRRTRIYSKKRGQGTFTVKFLKNLAESFENAEVDVIENNSNYCFEIKFIGIKGIPPNIEDLKSIIEQLKPAHLGVNYIFTFITWDEFDFYNKPWNEWDDKNLTWDEFETYKE